LIYPPFVDANSSWALDYEKEVYLTYSTKLPHSSEHSPKIKLNHVTLNEKANGNIKQFFGYRGYLKKPDQRFRTTPIGLNSPKAFKQKALHEMGQRILIERGYEKTNKPDQLFSNNHLDQFYIDLIVKKYNVGSVYKYPQAGFYFIDLRLEMTLLDFYKTPLVRLDTTIISGQFAYFEKDSSGTAFDLATYDALEKAIIQFLGKEPVNASLRNVGGKQYETTYDNLLIEKGDRSVSNLNQAISSSVTIVSRTSHGSGFAIGEDGFIVTNHHVVSDTSELFVVFNDQSRFPARVIRSNATLDLALLKIDGVKLVPFETIGFEQVEIGTDVFAIGTPTAQDLSQSVSKGIMSGIREGDEGRKYLQTDAKVSPGNSGGALVTKDGQVIAMISSKLVGYGVEGVAFGIPIQEVLEGLKINLERR